MADVLPDGCRSDAGEGLRRCGRADAARYRAMRVVRHGTWTSCRHRHARIADPADPRRAVRTKPAAEDRDPRTIAGASGWALLAQGRAAHARGRGHASGDWD